MDTVEQYQAKRLATLSTNKDLTKTGISCPKCTTEMVNLEPERLFTTAGKLPEKRVICLKCGYDVMVFA